MYENGRRVTGYNRKKIHKKVLNRKHYYRWSEYDGYVSPDRKYWKEFYLTGPRKVAKTCTNRKLRRIYNSYDMLHKEDIARPTNAMYRKYFDYWWTVY